MNLRITCALCKKIYSGETGRRLGNRFREHLRGVERNDKDASKPVARHFNLPNHSSQHMTICGLSPHQGNTESRKNLEQKFTFQIGTLDLHSSNERFSLIQLICSCISRCHFPTNSVAPPLSIYTKCNPQFLNSLRRRVTLEMSAFNLFRVANLPY